MSLRHNLSNLNDRLAAYMDRVRCRGTANLGVCISECECMVRDLRETYEKELSDARRTLDQVAIEKARLEVELREIRDEFRELKIRYTNKECNLEAAQARLSELEDLLSAKDAALNKALREKRALEAEMREMKEQLTRLEMNLADIKRELREEAVKRVDAQNQLQTEKEKLEFQKNVHKKELCKIKTWYESQLEGDRSEMSEHLAELRAQNEEQAHFYREELEEIYKSKLDKTKHLAERNRSLFREVHDELKQTKGQLEASQAQVRELEEALSQERCNMRHLLADKEREMEEKLDQMEENLDKLVKEKLDLQWEVNAYRNLLETEENRLNRTPRKGRFTCISCRTGNLGQASTCCPSTCRPSACRPSTCRPSSCRPSPYRPSTSHPSPCRPSTSRPSACHPSACRPSACRPSGCRPSPYRPSTSHPSPCRPSTRPPSPCRPSTRPPSPCRPSTSGSCSSKRRLECETPCMVGDIVAKSRVSQHASASGPVTVDKVDLDGKFIRLRNMSDKDQPLGNWQVKRQVGTKPPIIYKFPARFTLRAEGTVTIWASSGGGTHKPPTDLVWRGQDSWGTGDLLQTYLISAGGEEMAMRKVRRALFQDDEEADEDEAMEISSTRSIESNYNLRSRRVTSDGGDE